MPDMTPDPLITLTPPAPMPGAAHATAAAVQHYSWAFELTGLKNESMICPLDMHKCRGRWSKNYLSGQEAPREFASAPDLPGMVFVINTKARTIKRFDPLAQPQNAPVLKLAQRIFGAVMGVKYEPERPRTLTDVNDHDLKTMAYWFYKLVLCKRAALVIGAAPGFPDWTPNTPWRGKSTIDPIRAMPGLVRCESYNSSPLAKKFIPNDELHYRGPGEDDYRRDPLTADEIPDPTIIIPVGGAKNYGYEGGYPSTAAPHEVGHPVGAGVAADDGVGMNDPDYADTM